ncbi:MAG: hypothetical protein QG608_1859 [Actinomycetota bacterium]|nr:hypothetical protein [Actinomycetota bacterium]
MHSAQDVDGDLPALLVPFGERLRQWRVARGMSELELATGAGCTARQVSCWESACARPTRSLVLRLASTLDISLRERNQLLQAAGLEPEYRRTGLDSPDLLPYRKVMDRLLTAHEPFPALVTDTRTTVLRANLACKRLLGPDIVGSNLAERYFGHSKTHELVLNWTEVGRAGLTRLRRLLRLHPMDEELDRLVALAETALDDVTGSVADCVPTDQDTRSPVLCPWFDLNGEVIRTVLVGALFEAPAEITLDELRIELMYPQDEQAEKFFRDLV